MQNAKTNITKRDLIGVKQMDKVIPTNGTSAEDVKYANIVKKVYIDGVDVSECEYNKGYCRISALCDYTGHICEVNNNCYYKQLMRARAEIEELKDNKAIIKVLDNEIKISNKSLGASI